MGDILINPWMPYGDDVEARDFNGRFEHDQLLAFTQQPGWDERDKIVGLQNLRYEQEARHRVANLAPQLEARECFIRRALEGSTCRRHENVIVNAEVLNCHGRTTRERVLRADGYDVALAV